MKLLIMFLVFSRYRKSIYKIILDDDRIELSYRYLYDFITSGKILLSNDYKYIVSISSLEYVKDKEELEVYLYFPMKESLILMDKKLVAVFTISGKYIRKEFVGNFFINSDNSN